MLHNNEIVWSIIFCSRLDSILDEKVNKSSSDKPLKQINESEAKEIIKKAICKANYVTDMIDIVEEEIENE